MNRRQRPPMATRATGNLRVSRFRPNMSRRTHRTHRQGTLRRAKRRRSGARRPRTIRSHQRTHNNTDLSINQTTRSRTNRQRYTRRAARRITCALHQRFTVRVKAFTTIRTVRNNNKRRNFNTNSGHRNGYHSRRHQVNRIRRIHQFRPVGHFNRINQSFRTFCLRHRSRANGNHRAGTRRYAQSGTRQVQTRFFPRPRRHGHQRTRRANLPARQ